MKVVGGSCNLRCKYCFYDGHQNSPLVLMDGEVLEKVVGDLMKVSPVGIRFIWHGGEPMLAGIDYFTKIVQLQQRFATNGQMVENSIQTNGTLINEEWVGFFKKHDFKVGVSLDGPEHIHDQVRINVAQRGTYKSVMRGINLLREAEMTVGVIAVINSDSVNYPDELFNFFYHQGLNFNANECTAFPDDPLVVRSLAINPMEYAQFLLKIFDLWLEAGNPRYRVRPLVDFVHAVIGQQPKTCKMQGRCHQYITIDVNGDVYPCHAYLRPEHVLGNLASTGIEKFLEGPQIKQYYSGRLETLKACGDCQWVRVCNGGCMRAWGGKTALTDISEHQDCEALKLLYGRISTKLQAMGYSTIL